MKRIPPPAISFHTSIEKCQASLNNTGGRRDRLSTITEVVALREEAVYNNCAQSLNFTNANSDLFLEEATKEDLLWLYEYKLLKGNAREVYNQIIASAHLQKCPYCCVGEASTLDHYLPKSIYPIYSILPLNLIPSCDSCNRYKSDAVFDTVESQMLNPYFDDLSGIDWLVVTLLESSPLGVKYEINSDIQAEDPVMYSRLCLYLSQLKLYDIFRNNAISELEEVYLSHELVFKTQGSCGLKQELESRYLSLKRANNNPWKVFLYKSLMESSWYCESYFR